VAVRYPQVITHFPGDPVKQADLTVMAELRNASNEAVGGVLEGRFENTEFHQNVKLSPGEVRAVRFTPEEYAQLRVRDPKVWWPTLVGPQNLHSLTMRFVVAGAVSDEQQIRFGIREITAELDGPAPRPGKMFHLGSGKVFDTDTRPLLFRVNQKKILIRGAGWTPDLLLGSSQERLETQLQYVRDMNLKIGTTGRLAILRSPPVHCERRS
jgi:exo-1,4-beta-D-glucosaminidase